MKKRRKRFSKLMALLLVGAMMLNCFSYMGKYEANAEDATTSFTSLNPKVYKKSDTAMSRTGYSVSFQINDVAGIGYIPCGDRNTGTKYTPVSTVSGSGLYRNGVLEDKMFLATYAPNLGDNKYMQFVISWEYTDKPIVEKGDVFCIQGAFEHNSNGKRYELQFNKTEFIYNGEDWEQREIEEYKNLTPIVYLYGDTDESKPDLRSSVSFHVDVEGIHDIPVESGTHNVIYVPDVTVEGSGLYRNGVLDKEMYLAAFWPGDNTMQFTISWKNSQLGQIDANDIIQIKGKFEYIQEGKKFVLDFQNTEFWWKDSNWKTIENREYNDLTALLYTNNDSQTYSNDASVSFHVDTTGMDSIPTASYVPNKSVSGSGLYRNGVLEDKMTLETLSPTANRQFVIRWNATDRAAAEKRDVIKIQGQFEFLNHDGIRYILNFKTTEYMYTEEIGVLWATITETSFSGLQPILYNGQETGQSTAEKVSFHIDVSGIGNIPITEYKLNKTMESGGLYRNNELETAMTLKALSNNGNSNSMQFVISWSTTTQATVSKGDVVKIQGQFEYLTDGGSRYVLELNKAEFLYTGEEGILWNQVIEKEFKELEPVVYGKGQTSHSSQASVSFQVNESIGLGDIPLVGYAQNRTVEGSGLYRNDELETAMTLKALSNNGASNGMQFVISWSETTQTQVSEGDVIKIQGCFEYMTENGTRYILHFNTKEFVWINDDWSTTQSPESLGYSRITLQDFGLRNGTYTAAHTTGTFQWDSLDMRYLDMDMMCTGDNDGSLNTSIRYASVNGWTGIKIASRSGSMFYVYDANGQAVGYTLAQMGITSMTEKFNVKLATKISNQQDTTWDITYSLWINDILIAKEVTQSGVTGSGKMLGIAVNTDNVDDSISIGSPQERMNKKVSYDLKNGDYLLTGFDITVNGVKKDAGETLSVPGDYTIVSTADFITTTREIILYRVGDVDLDGSTGEKDDLDALQALLSGENTESLLLDAKTYGADLNNDEVVNAEDLTLMKKIVNGSTTIEKVVKKYQVSSVSFDFLGGDDVMPISGFYGPYRDSESNFLNEQTFTLMKECGINLILSSESFMGKGTEYSDEYAYDTIEMAEKYDIGFMMRDENLNAGITADKNDGNALSGYLQRYDYFNNMLGVHIKDEPSVDGVSEYTEVTKALNRYTNSLGWINALPKTNSLSPINNQSAEEYSNYLDSIIDAGVRVLSFDDYPFDQGETIEPAKSLSINSVENYFSSLIATQSKAKKNNLPFWGVVAAGGDWRNDGAADKTDADKQPTEAETYWNVNTMLAFGAKGITWFPLIQPSKFANAPNGTYDYDRNGLLSANQSQGTTKFYQYAVNMNSYIQYIDEVLMKSEHLGVVTTGGYAEQLIKKGYEHLDSGETLFANPIINVDDTTRLTQATSTNTTYGAIVGCFRYGDTESYYAMNYNTTDDQEIKLTFDGEYDYQVFVQGETAVRSGQGQSVTITLAAGQAALVVLNADMIFSVEDGFTLLKVDQPAAVYGTTVDGVVVEETLSNEGKFDKWGTFTITYVLNGTEYERKISSYLFGDITYDGTNDVKDLVRMKKTVLNMNPNIAEMEKISGDVIKDNIIDGNDLKALRELLIE